MKRVKAAPATEMGSGSRAPWVILGAIAAVLAVLGVACGALVSLLFDIGPMTHFSAVTPGVLKPIPIPSEACADLRAVHDDAASAGRGWSRTFLGYERTYAWQDVAAQQASALAAFELTLRAAIPRLPAPVASELNTVLWYVALGRVRLAAAETSHDYTVSTMDWVVAGYYALGNASDLVGNACGFKLMPRVDLRPVP